MAMNSPGSRSVTLLYTFVLEFYCAFRVISSNSILESVIPARHAGLRSLRRGHDETRDAQIRTFTVHVGAVAKNGYSERMP